MPDISLRGLFDDPRDMDADGIVALHRWLSIPRYATGIVGLAAVIGYWYVRPAAFDPSPFFFFLIPEYVLATMLVSRLVGRKVRPRLLLHAQILLDLAAVTFVVAYTGGIRSPFALLFLLVLTSASLLSNRALIVFGAASAIIFETMAVAEHAGFFPSLPSTAIDYQQMDAVTLVVFGLIASLIVFQNSYFVSRMREKDEETLKLKDEFIFRTIHDLRSPTTVVRLIADKYKTSPDPVLRNDTAHVTAALGRMSRLIEDLLKMATGDRPEFVVCADCVDMPDVVRGAADELLPVMSRRRVTFMYRPPADLPQVTSDAEKLKEVFSNLFDNAVKYNREGGSIAVTHAVEGKMLATIVTDTGCGIAAQALPNIFKPFFRGDVSKEVEGTGLGLYMTKKLVEKLKGDIAVSSFPGVGSTFTVRLPIAE